MRLLNFQSWWAMEELPFGGGEPWGVKEKVDRIVAAGFDGVEVAWTPSIPSGPEALERARAAGLEWAVICFPKTIDALKEVVELFAGSDIRHLNIQPNIRPMTAIEGIPYLLDCMEVTREAGLVSYFETHRDRLTTDLRTTIQLLDAIPQMRLVADLSHYLVGEEFPIPISDANQAMMHRILERSQAFHGRVASREQVQVPISFPHNKQWLDLFLDWWEEGFRLWRERAEADDALVFSTEMGPSGYAMLGADGRELADRWSEALLLRKLVRERWDTLAAQP